MNRSETLLRFPTSVSEVLTAGLCESCLEAPPAPQTLVLTEADIDAFLSILKEQE